MEGDRLHGGRRPGVSRALFGTYALLWSATVIAAGASAAGLRLGAAVSAPHDALAPTVATAWSLLSHNAVVALWPLALVALGWPQIPAVRRAGDALVMAQLASHGATVGLALGAQPGLWRFLPHLPAEWVGIAAPGAAWFLARRGLGASRALAGVSLSALLVAAALETWAVPL